MAIRQLVMNWNFGFLLLVCGLMGASCGTDGGEKTQQNAPQDSVAVISDDVPLETTAIPEVSLEDFPAGYSSAQLALYDSATHHATALDFPRSETDTLLNAVIRKYCVDFAMPQVPTGPVGEYANSNFSMWVVAMQARPQFLSIQFLEQSYYEGAAHYNHGNPCLNLDLRTRKSVPFTQMLAFSKAHSKADFCELTNSLNADAPGEISPQMLDAKLDYFLAADSLVLCFDDYDLGPSKCQLRLPIDTLAPFWTTKAKNYLQR